MSQLSHTGVGYTTAYMQQYRSQFKANISKSKPKKRILTDLTSFITQWRSTNEHSGIIFMIDANSDKEDEYFNQFLADTALNDIIPYFQPNLETQSTYRHGQTRLDYILVSDEVLRASNIHGSHVIWISLYFQSPGSIHGRINR